MMMMIVVVEEDKTTSDGCVRVKRNVLKYYDDDEGRERESTGEYLQ